MTEPLNHKLDVSKIKTLKDVKNVFECMCLISNASEGYEKYELIKEYFTIPDEPQELKLELPRKSLEEISQEFDEKIDKQIEDVEYKFAQLKYYQEYQFSKKITLGNSGTGLDFTLDNEHEVVEVNSGVAMYNTDSWSTWRTAFREALKLKATIVDNPDDSISIERLLAWSTKGEGQYGEYSIKGALDAIEYYDEVNGDMDKLRLSYEWEWLRSRFNE